MGSDFYTTQGAFVKNTYGTKLSDSKDRLGYDNPLSVPSIRENTVNVER